MTLSSAAAETNRVVRYELFIGGEWVTPTRRFPVRDPYRNELLGEVPDATDEETDRAVEAALAARETMADLPAYRRAALLHKVAELLQAHREELAVLIARENAKAVRICRGEVDRAVGIFRLAAEEARRIGGEVIPMDAVPDGHGRLAFTIREPIGVVGAITPFNYPLMLTAHKVAPALASGNTVVLKPSDKTPLIAYRLAELLQEAGVPAGAVNVISGNGPHVPQRLVRDPRIALITFTGSADVGKWIRDNAGYKRVTLELGSNAGVIVHDVEDLEAVANRCCVGSFAYAGQICISVQRIYVRDSLFEPFLQRLAAAAAQLRLGDPLADDTDLSVLITPDATRRVQAWIDEARSQGARVVAGGQVQDGMLPPTILTDVPEDARVVCAEVFGPVVTCFRYRHLDEAIDRINASRYGLQAGIYTRDIREAMHAVRRLQVGGVMINDIPMYRVDHAPYGGIKDSGMGREGVRYAIEEMTETKLVCINLS